jgi:flagellar hook assembly protein FlgD
MELSQNYPNPFNPATEIRYRLAGMQHVKLEIYDVNGQLLLTLADALHLPGEYKSNWNGKSASGEVMPSGVYFCRLRAGQNVVLTRKMTLLR